MAPALGASHALGDIDRPPSAVRYAFVVGSDPAGAPEAIVTFRLRQDQQVVLQIAPLDDVPPDGRRALVQAALWNGDGRLNGVFSGHPRQLVRYLRAGEYQIRVRRPPTGPVHERLVVTVEPGEPPKPKAWGLIGLGLIVLGLQLFHGSRAGSKRLGAVRLGEES